MHVHLRRPLSAVDPALSDRIAVELSEPGLAGEDLVVLDDAGRRIAVAEGRVVPADREAERCCDAFAVAAAAIGLLRREDVLPGPVAWAAGAPLGIRVDADVRRNARYVPARHVLELGRGDAGERAADDPDVIAHETGHALLHRLAPDLLRSWGPDGVAIHEAFADLVAVLALLDAPVFRERVVGTLAGLGGAVGLGTLGEGFARALGKDAIRTLFERWSLPGHGDPARQVGEEPHARSLVLSSALYAFLVGDLAGYVGGEGAERQLQRLANQMRRFVLRAFVYVPPGELAFADVARLLVAADRAVHGPTAHDAQEARLDGLFREAGMLDGVPPLTTPDPEMPPAPATGPDEAWAGKLAAEVGVPAPDRVSMERYRHVVYRWREAEERVVREHADEWLVRLAWAHTEPGPTGMPLYVRGGATAVFDAATGAQRAWIRTVGDGAGGAEARFAAASELLALGSVESGPLGLVPDRATRLCARD